jgi:hypothetical protein
MPEEKPTAAFALSLIGGILQLLLGIVVAAVFAAVGFLTFGAGWVFSILGGYELVIGLITIIGAVMMYNNPSSAHTWGIVILILSIISMLNIFSLIGGILGIIWKPHAPVAPPPAPP